ncbi:MAG: hypothetical protein RH948_01355 [Cyclobacteriaceae bacterium]
MTQETDNLSPDQSLDIIQSMISQAQGNIRKNSFYFILWGWVAVFANCGMYVMIKFTTIPNPQWIWLITIPAWIVSYIYGKRQGKKERKSTHLDRINMWIWICYGLCLIIMIFFMSLINFNINPVILVITALPTIVTGVLCKFRPLVIGGVSFYLFGIISFLMSPLNQFVIGAIAIICGYLIPGYLLRSTRENNV